MNYIIGYMSLTPAHASKIFTPRLRVYRVSQKEAKCSKLTKFYNWCNITMQHLINTTFILLCVKFQLHMSNIPEVMNAEGMMGQMGL